jgi:hypothetical protein
MANIQSGFSEIQDLDVTVWELFDKITSWTCPFRGRTKCRSFVEEFLENYTFWSSTQLSDKMGDVKFEWCKDNGRGLCYCSLFIHGVVRISEFPERESVL